MIGIIGAMDSEIAVILENMTNTQTEKTNHYTFYKGKLFDKDVVVVKCGVGKVNAALCTQMLLIKYDISLVINTGIAGATQKGLNIYDFVVSTEAVYHDFDTSFFGYKLGQVPGLPETFKADEKTVNTIIQSFEKSDLAKEHKIIKGRIASGDQFIAGGERKDFIINNFQPACVEMEGCAIAHTCSLFGYPFVIIRCMSDCADENVKVNYEEEKASKASSALLLNVIKEL